MIIVSHLDYEHATSRQLIDLKCEYCGKIFQKRKKDIIDSKRENSHTQVNFCSTKCLMLSKGKRIKTACRWCGKEIEKTLHELKGLKYKTVFCSDSCSAKYTNGIEDRKIKMSKLFTIHDTINCKHCGKQFRKKT